MTNPIKRVIVVFKTHLDIGYTASARSVVRTYREQFIPRAMELAETLRRTGAAERFIWTTGSWLIDDYLNYARPSDRRRMETAISRGDIAWHALPFTFHSELLTPPLCAAALDLAARLDHRFGRKTIAAKMTDIPGQTRGLIALMAGAGVRFLHLGVNPAISLPEVPPVFRWRDADNRELIVAYSGDYGSAVVCPGLPVALHFAHTYDNKGPQTVQEIHDLFARLRQTHPGAEVVAGTMDDFARELDAVRASLPIVTEEIGDNWIHGIASDPWKISRYRALARWHDRTLQNQPALSFDPAWQSFALNLLLIAEHTWGLDSKIVRPPNRRRKDWLIFTPGAWDTATFRRERAAGLHRRLEASWREQRAYLRKAVAALKPHPALIRAARRAYRATEPRRPELANATPQSTGRAIHGAGHRVRFNPHGALVAWTMPDGRQLADATHPLGAFSYQVFSPQDVERWYVDYVANHKVTESWSRPDFTKFGFEKLTGVRARRWTGRVCRCWRHTTEQLLTIWQQLRFVATASENFGCPREVWIEWQFPVDPRDSVRVTLQWFDKPACRIPEAAWFSFRPRVRSPRAWRLQKLGTPIDPAAVAKRGNRRLHAVTALTHPELTIETLDAPLVRSNQPTLFDFSQAAPNARLGSHFNLVNNTWGTNFSQWADDDMKFCFHLLPAAK
ncbi:MAG: DUF5054 domain-containing protein [Opitutaceae bacterium]|nr:DUF5054 domain-containing protein [Opitutaceae bacterium]